jgi:hypothetical protein
LVWTKRLTALCANKQISNESNIQWLFLFPGSRAFWLNFQRVWSRLARKKYIFSPSGFWPAFSALLKCATLVRRFRLLPFCFTAALPSFLRLHGPRSEGQAGTTSPLPHSEI